MHIHILGICGTFMGGLALIARQAGHRVTGSDANVYPPMSALLESEGVDIMQGYAPAHLRPAPDLVLVGNVMSRGREVVEYVLDRGLAYTSGPQWLGEQILRQRWVLAVAGTHGKTTTTSLLAWILEYAGLRPGFLIGGVADNFGVSARLGDGPFFVIEADEYDTAFFDKRSKFVHYHPRTLVLNNLEFDHADIFDDLAAIERQFHHLIRIVPGNGLLVRNGVDANLDRVLERGCWTPEERFALQSPTGWSARPLVADGSAFEVLLDARSQGEAHWPLMGDHNLQNGLAAVAAARHAGVPVETSLAALAEFAGVKRRLELRGEAAGVRVYDDFAHHPTAIRLTLQALRARVGDARIFAVLEPRSNTMRLGVHRDTLAASLQTADRALLYAPPDLGWDAETALRGLAGADVYGSVDNLVRVISEEVREGDQVLVMSNGDFGGIHRRLLDALTKKGVCNEPSA